jgi:hypothetical protein
MRINRFWILLVFLVPIQSTAQYMAAGYNSDIMKKFLTSKTLVVLKDNPRYDAVLKESIKTYWKYTKYSFISEDEVSGYLEKQGYSLLMPIDIEDIRSNDIGTYIQRYHYLGLFNSGKNSLIKYHKDDILAYAVFDFEGAEQDRINAIYRLPVMVKSIVDAIETSEKSRFEGNPKKLQTSLMKYYNKKTPVLKKKTLLVNQDYFKRGVDKDNFSKAYPLKWEAADKEKIEKAIREKDPAYAFMIIAETTDKHLFVFDCSNGNVIYAAYKVVGKMFTKSDIKKLIKSAS